MPINGPSYAFGRRHFLGVASACLGTAPYVTLPTRRSTRLSVADSYAGHNLPAAWTKARLAIFEKLGIGTLRTGVGWRGVESQAPGRGNTLDEAWLKLAMAGGFRLKLMIGSLSAAPGWFLNAHPDASIRDARGETIAGVLSPWWPSLNDLLAEKAEMVFAQVARRGLFEATDYVIVDLGTAGEPLYPAKLPSRFWFWDVHSGAAFRAAMQEKYSDDLARANRVWQRAYARWSDVGIPIPGTERGPLWNDVLLWYRDSKRRVISQQVQLYQRLIEKYGSPASQKLIILVPGQHLTDAIWSAAVATGMGQASVNIMVDTEFLLETAHRERCWLQTTGCEVLAEDTYITRYLSGHGYRIPVWGENAGGQPADNPHELATAILNSGLYGLEYIDSSHIVSAEGLPRSPVFEAFEQACAGLMERWA